MDFEKYKEIIEQKETPKRFFHSLCVADSAKELAEIYGGCDPEKAYLAGLLHDIMKNVPDDEMMGFFKEYGIELTPVEKGAKKLWHAMAGAEYLKSVLKIDDSEILDAVRYHTTAKPEMSPLCKILYVADFISADRDYKGVEEIRQCAKEDIDKAVLEGLSFTTCELVGEMKPVHIDTVSAYNYYVLN